ISAVRNPEVATLLALIDETIDALTTTLNSLPQQNVFSRTQWEFVLRSASVCFENGETKMGRRLKKHAQRGRAPKGKLNGVTKKQQTTDDSKDEIIEKQRRVGMIWGKPSRGQGGHLGWHRLAIKHLND